MEISLPYGRTSLTAHIPDIHPVHVIEASKTAPAAAPRLAVEQALENLLGHVSWETFRGAKSVAIAVNDKTRPVPHGQLLPPLMDHLSNLGITDSAITFFVAVGSHPPMAANEFAGILPFEFLSRYRVVSHDSEKEMLLTYLGKTSLGTPVWANREYVESELKIVVGNIEPHQFAGFSGGVKTAAIGLSGINTININHTLMTHPDSLLGTYETNPARQDIEEIGEKFGVHIALNVILNHQRSIVTALAGDPLLVMKHGLEYSRDTCQVGVDQKYGMIISSPGGYPKDINVYQAQKGLAHATLITRPGGVVILVAACPEGSGSSHYETWALGKKSYVEVIEKFNREGFHLGPHKAYQIARDASRVRLMTCTDMDHEMARALLLNPVPNLQTAITLGLECIQPGEPVGILPHAVSTIPFVR